MFHHDESVVLHHDESAEQFLEFHDGNPSWDYDDDKDDGASATPEIPAMLIRPASGTVPACSQAELDEIDAACRCF